MKFVEPKVEYWQQPSGEEGMWDQIARVTRLCYDSKPREGETSKEFVNRVILKPSLNKVVQAYDFDKQHGGMLEFGTIYLIVPSNKYRGHDIEYYFPEDFDGRLLLSSPNRVNHEFALTNNDGEHCFYITTNLRYILENEIEWLCKQYIVDRPTPFHKQRYCFHVITNIGVSREWNRHRSSMSIAEQSTRYVDFTKKNHGGGLTFARSSWIDRDDINKYFMEDYKNIPTATYKYLRSLNNAEHDYLDIREAGWRPEQARVVLPLETKTEVAYCAFTDSWKHFCLLRSSMAVSGKPHPDIVPLADNIAEYLHF
jgi:thymidylate synthase (FAD)